jgi:hypothetical protein
MEEWHEYDLELRREHVLFEAGSPHFLLREHPSILCIEMFDDRRGHIRLRIRRPRKFFAKVLPDARFFFWRSRRLPPRAAPAAWCASIPRGLIDK